MQREIKFRAWHKNMNHMCQNATTNLIDKDYLEFMQYTGLKDKNSAEIYEGDILKIQDYVLGDVVGKIEFNIKTSAFIFNYINWVGYKYLDEWIEKSEIIGNVYENPEKLK